MVSACFLLESHRVPFHYSLGHYSVTSYRILKLMQPTVTSVMTGRAGGPPALRGSLPRISTSASKSEGVSVVGNFYQLVKISPKHVLRFFIWRLRRSDSMHSASCRMQQAGSLRSPERTASPFAWFCALDINGWLSHRDFSNS